MDNTLRIVRLQQETICETQVLQSLQLDVIDMPPNVEVQLV
jgi:hypothetical protein